ncbi:uncharacterized protein LOC141905572 isoform X2 [Tubulanus polymorphus]|uniref:uncharacterized protein LOC141905572 isoform X2 n=1 Tax=Tubulanus polymorphus TaxID=672921 RepID=UPI003DA3F66E
MATVTNIPDEILIRIFRNLTGYDSARSRTVCHKWNSILRELTAKDDAWTKFCANEIDEDILLDISSCRDLNEIAAHIASDIHPFFAWKTLYVKWYRMRRVKTWKKIRTEIPCCEEQARVFTVKFNGDFLFTGSMNCGNVSIWNHLTCELVDVVTVPGKTACGVTDIQLFYQQNSNVSGENVCHTMCDLDGDELSNVNKELMLEFLDINLPFRACLICYRMGAVFTDLYNCFKKDNRRQFICIKGKNPSFSAFGNRVVMAAADHVISGHRVVELAADHLKPQLRYNLYGHAQPPLVVKIWKNEVMSLSSQGDLLVWDLSRGKSTADVGDDVVGLQTGLAHEVINVFEEVVHNLILRTDIIICVTVSGLLFMSTNHGYNFVKHNVWESLGGNAVLAALWGSLFVIGTTAVTSHSR